MRFRLLLLALVSGLSTGVVYLDKPPVVEVGGPYERVGAGTVQLTPTIRHVGSSVDVQWDESFGSACPGLGFDSLTIEIPTVTSDGTTGSCAYMLNTTDVASRFRQDNVTVDVYGQCNDGVDNDTNGLTDYPEDPGCESIFDDTEVSALPAVDECVSDNGTATVSDGTARFTIDISSIASEGDLIISAVTCGNNVSVGGSAVTMGDAIVNGNNLDPGVIGSRLYQKVVGASETILTAGCGTTNGTPISVAVCKVPNAVIPAELAVPAGLGKDNQTSWTGQSITTSTPGMIFRSLHMSATGGALTALPYNSTASVTEYASDGSGVALDRAIFSAGATNSASATFASGRSGMYAAVFVRTSGGGEPTPTPGLSISPTSVSVGSSPGTEASSITISVSNIGDAGTSLDWSCAVQSAGNCGTPTTTWASASGSGTVVVEPDQEPDVQFCTVTFPASDDCNTGPHTAVVTVTAPGVGNSPLSTTITLTKSSGNVPPTVDAGANISIVGGGTVQLNGAIVDPDDTVTPAWAITSGTGGGQPCAASTLSSSTVLNPTFVVANVTGTCTARLTGNDGTNPAVFDDVTINVTETTGGGGGGDVQVIQRNGITFTLNTQYNCGQYFDGEWWCMPNTPGANVTLAQPPFPATTGTGESMQNGWQANVSNLRPSNGQDGCTRSGGCVKVWHDGRISKIANSALVVQPPSSLSFPAGTSIIKTTSLNNSGCPSSDGGTHGWTCNDAAAVLTIVAENPTAGCAYPIRPPYPGSTKPAFCGDDIDYDLLPDLSLLSSENQYSFAEVNIIFGAGGPWPPFASPGWWNVGRSSAMQNQKRVPSGATARYAAGWAVGWAAAALRTTQTGTDAEKRETVLRLIGQGLDAYYGWKQGMLWHSDGGIFQGAKPLILYAGYMLQDATILTDPGLKGAVQQWQEDMFTYRSTCGGCSAEGTALWGDLAQPGSSCSTETSVAQQNTTKRCAQDRDGGRCQSGSACPGDSPGGTNLMPTPAQQIANGRYAYGSYQSMADTYFGSAAMANILPGLRAVWEWEPFFEYIDRIAGPPWNGAVGPGWGDSRDYVYQMYITHGDTETPAP